MRNLLILLLPTAAWAYDFRCNLYCANDGICQHGKGKFGSYAGMQDDEAMPWEQETTQNGLYCACGVGYTGLQCEIKLVVCGENGEDQHTCFNGAECRKERASSGEVFYRCECDAANSNLEASYAGRYCEHIATTFCDQSGSDGSFGESTSFCTNGGACKPKESSEEKHSSCDCPPDWKGSHCQTPVESQSSESMVTTMTSKKNVGRIIGFVVLATFFILFLCCMNDKRVARKQKEKQRKRRLMGMSDKSYTKRRSQQQRQQQQTEGEMA